MFGVCFLLGIHFMQQGSSSISDGIAYKCFHVQGVVYSYGGQDKSNMGKYLGIWFSVAEFYTI